MGDIGTVLKTIPYTDETAKKIVKKFCDHVHWLVRVRHVYKVLFEDESCWPLIEKTALGFFVDLNRILQEYLLLECAKITDPATTGNNENFTVDTLIGSICWPNDILRKLTPLRATTWGFRKHIKTARDKLLAHLDRGTILSDKPLGEFPEGEDRAFFEALQKVCDITHEACFGTIFGHMSLITVGGGDVISLRRTLECAVAFKQALLESSGQNKTWLYSCLQKVGHESES